MAWKCVFFRHGFWHPFSTPFGMDFSCILDPNLAPKSRDGPGIFRSRLALVFYLTFEPPWSDYGGHLGPSWGHLGLIFEPSCALLDHLGGILAHLSGSLVAKLPGRGIIDPEFFPMLQISQKSTKTKPLCAPRCQKKKAGGRRSSPAGESIINGSSVEEGREVPATISRRSWSNRAVP